MGIAIALIRVAQLRMRVQIVKLIVGVVMIGFAKGHPMWGPSVYGGIANKNSAFGRLLARTPGAVVLRGLGWLTHHVGKALSHQAAVGVAPLTHTLQAHAHRARALNQSHAAFAEETATATYRMRHNVMPREIHRKVAPVAATAAAGVALGRRSISLGQKERRERKRSISHINTKLGALAAGFLGIDYLVKRGHRAYHHRSHARADRATTHDIPRIKVTQRTHARRISRLEKLLGVTALTAVVTAILARTIPSWRCSNFRNIRRLLRCSHWRWLEAVLFLAVDALTLQHLCDLVATMQSALESIVPRYIEPLVLDAENFICGGRASAPWGIVASDWEDVPARTWGV